MSLSTTWRRLALVAIGAWCAQASAGRIDGTVRTASGETVRDALVAATSEPPERDHDGGIVRHLARSDAQGHFTLDGLPAGVYGATATAAERGAAWTGPLVVDAQGRVDAQLVLAPTAVRVYGDIRTADGARVPGAVAILIAMDDRPGARFFVDGASAPWQVALPAGSYAVGAVAPGWRSIVRPLPPTSASSRADIVVFRVPPSNPSLRAELLAMSAEDQRVREGPVASDARALDAMRAVDRKNQARLHAILERGGWPKAAQVGADGVAATWLMVQHDVPAIKRWLPAMRAAVDAGELPAADWALSIDRDRVHDGRPQLYGSQGLPSKDGKFAGLQPIEDEDHVDERRAALGMEPLAAYKAALAREYDR
jgi:hypothetical protein